MGERSRPRDLYDIVNLFRREDLRLEQELIRSTLERKCESKGIPIPTHADISSSPLRAELESEWANMLGHQLPVLPPFEHFWEEAKVLFQWLEGEAIEEPVEPIGAMASEDRDLVTAADVGDLGPRVLGGGALRRRQPPARRARLQRQHPLDRALLAAQQQRRRPAALRDPGRHPRNPLLPGRQDPVSEGDHAALPAGLRDRVRVLGSLAAPLVRRRAGVPRLGPRRSARRSRSGPTYIIRCTTCGKEFRRKTRSTAMRKHKAPGGWLCPGRRGQLVRTT